MPRNLKLSSVAVNAEADALAALANDGFLRIYDGAQPANGNAAITTQTMLAELRLANPAFGAAVDGVITANSIMPDDHAAASGAASWCRFFKSDGFTALWDGSVGQSDSLLDINSVNIQQNAVVSISAYQHTVPKS